MLGGVVLQADGVSPMPTAQLLALPFVLCAGLALLGAGAIFALDTGSTSLASADRQGQDAINRSAARELLLRQALLPRALPPSRWASPFAVVPRI
jgi:hypothetical protein